MGFLNSIGNWLNDATGATASAKLQNQYQKEFAQNAHQWEMQDLQKAGLNPALTAGGGGASAGGAGGSTGSSGINPLDAIGSLIGMRNQTTATNADNNLKNAQAMQIIEMLPFNKDEKLQIIQNLMTGSQVNLASAKLKKEQTRTEAVKDLSKKQARNFKELMNERTKEDNKKIKNAKNQSEFDKALYLGI